MHEAGRYQQVEGALREFMEGGYSEELRGLILYGSFARGTSHAKDIDVMPVYAAIPRPGTMEDMAFTEVCDLFESERLKRVLNEKLGSNELPLDVSRTPVVLPQGGAAVRERIEFMMNDLRRGPARKHDMVAQMQWVETHFIGTELARMELLRVLCGILV